MSVRICSSSPELNQIHYNGESCVLALIFLISNSVKCWIISLPLLLTIVSTGLVPIMSTANKFRAVTQHCLFHRKCCIVTGCSDWLEMSCLLWAMLAVLSRLNQLEVSHTPTPLRWMERVISNSLRYRVKW